MKTEKERLEEDLNMVLDDIESYNEDLRLWEHYGKAADDFTDITELEEYINTLCNEAMYLEACLNDTV